MAGGELSYRNEGSSTLEPARTGLAQGLRLPAPLVAAILVALAAFICYHATLLPGLDLGDSASFQTGVGSLTLTPRQAYPLYYALGNIFVWLDPNEPAHAMNLASAVYGAIAVGLGAALVAELAGSTLAGLTGGLFLAFSYTFWTQAITAEVYTLHLLIMGAAMLALLSWSRRLTLPRLALFYAIYALGFGNHLSMILLLPAFAVFILMSRHEKKGYFLPQSPQRRTENIFQKDKKISVYLRDLCVLRGENYPCFDPLRPKAIALAAAIAGLAALQYSWNFRGLWADPEPPATLVEAVRKFWFDVTKADWRETLVMGLSEAGLQNRPAMYWFDLRQQFGIPGVVLAGLGIAYVMAQSPRSGILLLLLYATNLAFAWTYNVGDPYIFFLPSHYVVALCAGAGVAALMWLVSRLGSSSPNSRPGHPVWLRCSSLTYSRYARSSRLASRAPRSGTLATNFRVGTLASRISSRAIATTIGASCLVYPAWRGYDTFPAVDRSTDNRAVRLLDQLTAPINHSTAAPRKLFCEEAIFSLDANWQVQNAAAYYMREYKPGVSWFTLEDLTWLEKNPGGFSRFVYDNVHQGAREVVLTPETHRKLQRLKVLEPQLRGAEQPKVSLADQLRRMPRGMPYVFAVLRPDRESPIGGADVSAIWSVLTNAQTVLPIDTYTVVVGRIGERPQVIKGSNRPYRLTATIGPLDFDVRMESWLPTDTIRRSGFGHVIVNRTHTLTLERGISMLVIGESGPPVLKEYRAGLFEPPRRSLAAWNDGDAPSAPCYR